MSVTDFKLETSVRLHSSLDFDDYSFYHDTFRIFKL